VHDIQITLIIRVWTHSKGFQA